MDALSIITLAMGAAWASGINLYATVLLVGLLGTFGLVPLPDGLSPLTSPIVLGVVGLLLALFKPVVFLIFVLVFFLAALWLLPKIWRGLRRLYQRFAGKQGPDAIADQRPGFELSSLDRND